MMNLKLDTVSLFYNTNLIDTDIENVEKSAYALKRPGSLAERNSSYLKSLEDCITKLLEFHDKMYEKNKKQLTDSLSKENIDPKKLRRNS